MGRRSLASNHKPVANNESFLLEMLHYLVAQLGFEPRRRAPKARVLPLHYRAPNRLSVAVASRETSVVVRLRVFTPRNPSAQPIPATRPADVIILQPYIPLFLDLPCFVNGRRRGHRRCWRQRLFLGRNILFCQGPRA